MKAFLFLIAVLVLTGCYPSGYQQQPVQVNVQPEQANLNQSLNLQAVGALAQRSPNAQAFEQALNTPSSGVNNLDMEGTGHINYINVQEVSTGPSRAFNLSTSLSDGSTVQLAQVQIQPVGSQIAQMTVTGNQQFYPQNNSYQSNVNTANLLLWAYLMSPHSVYYHSSYYYGHYPSYYHSYSPISSSAYSQRTRVISRSSAPFQSSTVRTPSFKQTPLSSPAMSQKGFAARSMDKPIGGGGFGGGGLKSSSSSASSMSAAPTKSAFGGGGFGKKKF